MLDPHKYRGDRCDVPSVRIRSRSSLDKNRRAFTLLEVILALAILGATIAALGEVMRSAGESGQESAALTQAQIIASSIMSNITSGAVQLTNATREPVTEVTTTPPWVFSVQISTTPDETLVAVEVKVEQDVPSGIRALSYSVTRWMPDPNLATSTTGTTSSGTSSGSTTSGAGGAR